MYNLEARNHEIRSEREKYAIKYSNNEKLKLASIKK
jgi:hypothetical protein